MVTIDLVSLELAYSRLASKAFLHFPRLPWPNIPDRIESEDGRFWVEEGRLFSKDGPVTKVGLKELPVISRLVDRAVRLYDRLRRGLDEAAAIEECRQSAWRRRLVEVLGTRIEDAVRSLVMEAMRAGVTVQGFGFTITKGALRYECWRCYDSYAGVQVMLKCGSWKKLYKFILRLQIALKQEVAR